MSYTAKESFANDLYRRQHAECGRLAVELEKCLTFEPDEIKRR